MDEQTNKSYWVQDWEYKEILRNILNHGVKKQNRTGVDTLSLFNTKWSSSTMLKDGKFPLMTCRKTYFKGALVELFWILGILQAQNPIPNLDRNNVAYLQREGCNYWDKWADKNGDLGPVYGAQLMEWEDNSDPLESTYINQIQNIIDKLRTDPDDRRLVCTMWRPDELDRMALPPCHHTIEFYSKPLEDGKRELNLRWMQRSCDMPIGVPYDITMYALLLFMISKMTNHIPGEVIGLFGDSHIYENQIDGVKEMLLAPFIPFPDLVYSGPEYVENLNDFKLEWFRITNYNYFKEIKLPVTV